MLHRAASEFMKGKIAMGAALACLLPLGLLALFAHPAADDFPISHTARDWGSYTTVVGYYKCWSARYTSLFLMSLNPLVFGWFKAYKLGAPLLMAALFLSLLYFFRSFYSNAGRAVMAAVFFLSVFLLNLPDLPGGLYYLGGAFFYQPGNIFLLLLTGSFMRFPPPLQFQGLSLHQWLAGILQATMLVLLAGCNEIGMLLALVFPIAGFLLQAMLQKRPVYTWLLFLLLSLLCSLLILKSPATFYRMEASGSFGRSLPAVMQNAFAGMMQALLRWLSSPAVPVFLLLIAFFSPEGKVAGLLSFGWRLALSLASALLFFTCFIPSYLGEGLLQGRTENSLLFLFLFLVILNLSLWLTGKQGRAERLKDLFPVFFVLLLPFSPGFKFAVSDLLSGEAAAYSAERDRRDSLMRSTSAQDIELEPVRHRPRSIFAGDIGDYPDPWYDNHFAAMYGKKSVRVKKARPGLK